jgi:4-diphosphocytidyl-2-C-methyl-D-erythritol kinase
MPLLILEPDFAIDTRSAYQTLSIGNATGNRADVIQPMRLESWDAVQQDAVNDFEPALFPKYPLLPQLRAALREAEASLALLSGSGSSVFGLFPLERSAARAAKRIRDRFPRVGTIETRTTAWTGR